MPQFDTFIFSSSLVDLVFWFFILLYINFFLILPRLGAILKLREKIVKKSTLVSDKDISDINVDLTFNNLLTA